ncbi:MAG TPA: TolC family protein [Vicinamibacterales bacterium]|nr:TolC family protein [Vicinamibacterales bacterium]
MRRRSSRIAYACAAAALLLAPCAARAQSAAPLTLDAAIARAIASNRSLAAARLALPGAVAGVGVAGERLNPELSYEYAKETPHQAIAAAFPIELGGKRRRRIDLANATVSAQEAEIAKTAVDLRDRVRRAYFALVGSNRRVALADDIVGLATRVREAAQARFNAGDVPRLELVQAELALVESENEASAARGEARAATGELNVLLAQPIDTSIVPADDLSRGGLPSLDAAIALATGANADLIVLDRQIAEQTARRDLAVALKSPDVTAGAAYTYDAQPEFSQGYRASVALTVPLFTRHNAAVAVEDAELARLKAAREATAIELGGTVAAALARATAARDQLLRSTAESLPRAQEVERMAQDSYSSGQSGLVTLLQALQFTRDVRRRNLDAGTEYQRALADLERAIGAPLP